MNFKKQDIKNDNEGLSDIEVNFVSPPTPPRSPLALKQTQKEIKEVPPTKQEANKQIKKLKLDLLLNTKNGSVTKENEPIQKNKVIDNVIKNNSINNNKKNNENKNRNIINNCNTDDGHKDSNNSNNNDNNNNNNNSNKVSDKIMKKTKQLDLSTFIKGVESVHRNVETKYEPVKIPNEIKRTWARTIEPFKVNSNSIEGSKYIEYNNIEEIDMNNIGEYEGILMDPPWNKITPEQLTKLKITDNLIKCGLLFIWTPKELYWRVINALQSWKFEYVENLVWVQLTPNNKLLRTTSQFFKKSKLSLLLFKKTSSLKFELRHQRNPDVVFDFVKEENNKPEEVYHVIETLLPNANFDESKKRGKFLQIWCSMNFHRKSWTTIHIRDSSINNNNVNPLIDNIDFDVVEDIQDIPSQQSQSNNEHSEESDENTNFYVPASPDVTTNETDDSVIDISSEEIIKSTSEEEPEKILMVKTTFKARTTEEDECSSDDFDYT